MYFDSNHHGNGSSNLTANLTKRKGKKSDRNGQYSNGAHLPDVQMVPKIRVVSGGYEPVTVIQEDRSASDLENGDAFAQTDEHQLENGHLVEQNFENEIGEAKAKEETSFTIAFEVLIPFLIAGLGTVGAGLLLDKVQHDDVFEQISEIFILVPALLGLKGNLEMTLASRLSTAANVGSIDSKSEQWKLITGNMVLIQVQAIVVATLAATAAVTMGWVVDGHFDINHATLLCASSLVTATIASLILGSLMVAIIVLSRKLRINPDNIATPIAASLGDLVTLALLSGISSFLHRCLGSNHWIAPLIIASFFLILPSFIYFCHHNIYTQNILYNGWNPVISAMVISSTGGVILDYTVANYKGIAVYNPVINGVGGNLVAVQASRISTSLHQKGKPGEMPEESGFKGCLHTFFGKGQNARAARVLLALAIPGHLIFLNIIAKLQAGHTTLTLIFTVVYLLVGFLQGVLLLLTADWLVHFIWKRGSDPDNVAIPYLTALGDLLGTGFLAVAFHILWLVGDRDSDVGD